MFIKIIFSIIVGLVGFAFFGGGVIGLIIGLVSLFWFYSQVPDSKK